MAALVASPLYLPSRDDGGDNRSQSNTGTGENPLFSSGQTSELGLARFTNNPIVFIKASEPTLTSVPLSSKYEILDDSKLDVSKTPSMTAKTSRFIGPLLPHTQSSQQDQDTTTDSLPIPSTSTTAPATIATSSIPSEPPQRLWTGEILNSFPVLNGNKAVNIARGLDNVGNTCFLNSVLQCLLHTPQLLQVVLQHFRQGCKDCNKKDGFCMMHAFAQTAWAALYAPSPKSYVRPAQILGNLTKIAKGIRRGRQEDAHEFLRYSIDAFQRAALAGTDPKLPHSVKETTWVHKLFGGRLRSRVTCQVCKHNSDTFDSLLDLSIDIHRKESVRDALDAFVAIERLAGADKYNCEKCKKPVIAEKQFTIHDAPQILTVHLKRFTPMGRKLTQPVKYAEQLSLARYMSDGQFGPSYSLYGVISHAGGGPNSGHYYAHVKSANGTWHEMNDESVTPVSRPPLNLKNAYILFYMRAAGSSLQSAIHPSTASIASQTSLAAPAEIFSIKDRADKRKRSISQDDEEEDLGVKATSFNEGISPKRAKTDVTVPDPAATALKAKITAVTTVIPTRRPTEALSMLAEYDGQSSEAEDLSARVGVGPSASPKEFSSSATAVASSSILGPPSTPPPVPAAPRSRALLKDIFPDAPSPPMLTPTLSPGIASSNHDSSALSPSAMGVEQPQKEVNTGIPPEQFYGSRSSRRGNRSGHNDLDENDHHYEGGGRRNSGDWRDRDGQHSTRHYKHNRDKSRWKVNGSNAFSAAILRGNLHEDRSGPSNYGGGGGSFNSSAESKRNRMNKKKRSLM